MVRDQLVQSADSIDEKIYAQKKESQGSLCIGTTLQPLPSSSPISDLSLPATASHVITAQGTLKGGSYWKGRVGRAQRDPICPLYRSRDLP